MNKIFSKVAVATLMSAVVSSALYAGTPSKLYVNSVAANYNDANTSGANASSIMGGHNEDGNASLPISIDILGQGTVSQLVFSPYVNLTSGSKFTLEATGAEFVLSREASLCNGRTVIGKLVSVGPSTSTPTQTMNNMSFRIIDSADDVFKKNNFSKDGNYTFAAGNVCSTGGVATAPLSLTSNGDACQAVSVRIPTSIDDSSQAFEDYTTPAVVVGTTKRYVTISCTVPVCSIDINTNQKTFTTTSTPAGINQSKNNVTTNLAAATISRDYSCANCGKTTSKCVTTIFVKNAAGSDFNVTKLSVTPTFDAGLNAGMTFVADGNRTGAKISGTFGTAVEFTDFNVSANSERNITLTYTPATDAVISEGTVAGKIVLGATKGSALNLSLTAKPKAEELATFKIAGSTVFTVPYMNSNNHGFVKITTDSANGAKLSATITDQNGKQTSKDLADLIANGTVYLFSDSGPLKEMADAAGLANAWTVDFTTTAAATVVSYMPTKDGERTVIAY